MQSSADYFQVLAFDNCHARIFLIAVAAFWRDLCSEA
jgi:hypothetical protein